MNFTRVLKYAIGSAALAGALLTTTITPPAAHARVFLSVGIAPPVIPIYDQPLAPGYGYIWTPGYWAYGDAGYYWVDGAWVYPPYVGALWTPGYWGYGGGGYLWNAGYWGRSIGFYGGINYGFGYFGTGFWGGYWNGGRFFYNSAYNHLGFHNGFIYNHPVSGFDGHPGGQAFARNEGGAFNRGGESFNRGGEAFNRGSSLNGNSFANHTATENRGFNNGGQSQARSFAGNTESRGSYNGGGQTQARSFSSGNNYGGGNYGGGNYGGGSSHPSYSGGGGGGGSFHGGGGGGGSHGGGGHR